MRDHTLYLKDILAAIESIESFIAGMDLDTFHTDDKTSSAVVRKLEIIGEAVKQLPEELRQQHSQVPWRDGRHEGQANPFLLWSGSPAGLENNYRTAAAS